LAEDVRDERVDRRIEAVKEKEKEEEEEEEEEEFVFPEETASMSRKRMRKKKREVVTARSWSMRVVYCCIVWTEICVVVSGPVDKLCSAR